MFRALFLSLLTVCCLLHRETVSLNVLSFNVRQFGTSKYSKQDVVNSLIEIVRGYDLILIIELVDVSQTVLPGFVDQLNQAVANNNLGVRFNYSVSERVGQSVIKEQYAFIYRTGELEVLDSYQYPDSNDVFERPPYAVLVRTTANENNGDLPSFFLIASHTKPTDAPAEINHLDDVFNAASVYFSNTRGTILGDLNADCTYLSASRYETLDLVVNTSFTWWIRNDIDTTTGSSNCAYDRIITSSSLTSYVVNDSARVVLFDRLYQLNSTQTAAISDHYPVQISLRGDAIGGAAVSQLSGISFLLLCLVLTVALVL